MRQLFANFSPYKCYQVYIDNTQELVVKKVTLKKEHLG